MLVLVPPGAMVALAIHWQRHNIVVRLCSPPDVRFRSSHLLDSPPVMTLRTRSQFLILGAEAYAVLCSSSAQDYTVLTLA